jgi:hypothetical protein
VSTLCPHSTVPSASCDLLMLMCEVCAYQSATWHQHIFPASSWLPIFGLLPFLINPCAAASCRHLHTYH